MARRKKPDPARLRKEILGLLVAATGGFLLLALWPYDPALRRLPSTVNLVGVVGAVSAFHLYDGLGYGAILAAVLLLLWGGLVFLERVTGKAALISAAAGAAGLAVLVFMGVASVWSGGGGPWDARAGRLGRWLAGLAVEAVGVAGAVIGCVVILAVLAAVVFRISLAQGVRSGVELGRVGGRRAREGVGTLGTSVADWRARRAADTGIEPRSPETSAPNGGPPPPVAPEPQPTLPRPVPPRPRPPAARRGSPAVEPDGFIPPLDLLDRAQLVEVTEALLVDAADIAPETRHVVAHHMRPVLAVGPRLVALVADVLAGVEHDGDGQRVVFLGDAHELRPVLLAHAGGVDDNDLAPLEAGLGDDVQEGEGVSRGIETVLVVLHHAAAGI